MRTTEVTYVAPPFLSTLYFNVPNIEHEIREYLYTYILVSMTLKESVYTIHVLKYSDKKRESPFKENFFE